ncbi:oxidoreductase NAD-binding domain protein [Actinomyces naeslundii str. Howell 279]|uniref:Oxidoreductase NAD-binding domain protein n=1 Tax=Actinomyces naeslundii (strain ATCC 12104 / DSM 43013 / CCUG 2238 / JCM 8349 / NCTC 10301 / Howell 279) TaxID=1115803 RepID=J3JJL0_ACTNH|nr:oxidoreductase NAD-binding domain protein [Actinomyces naeslundii str. Howell 279]
MNRDLDHEGAQRYSDSLLEGRPHDVFVSFPSLKSGESPHTAELISFCDARAFRQWAEQPRENRGPEYSTLKERIARGMLELAESAAPGLTELVDYVETSTPLTYEHYTAHPDGAFYGPPATPQRYRSSPLGPRTAIPGLFLSGQDAGSTGIMGAMMGGLAAACQVLGPRGYSTITSAVRESSATPVPHGARTLPEGKYHAVLVSKRRLTPSVWDVTLHVDGDIDHWAPGQFARLHVGDNAWRDYSIAGLDDHRLRLLISTRTGGRGSQFIEQADTGTRTVVETPLGGFGLAGSGRRRLFIATGTGIAPMLAMFAQAPGLEHDTLLFGCRHRDEDLTSLIDSPMPGRVVRCLSREEVPDTFHGRVTDALPEVIDGSDLDPDRTDVYLCGSAAMVSDTHRFLERAGYESIHTEPY